MHPKFLQSIIRVCFCLIGFVPGAALPNMAKNSLHRTASEMTKAARCSHTVITSWVETGQSQVMQVSSESFTL